MITRKLSRCFGNVPLHRIGNLTSISQTRFLYSGEELGIKSYEKSRKTVEHAIANHAFFKQQFGKQLMNPDYSYTHVEMGVKNLVHIMTGSPSDITLLMSALYQLIQKENEWHGDKYRFDSVVMRAFYYLNLPDEAIKVFDDPVIGLVFKRATSYQILLDLLYENEMYDDVLRIYGDLISSNRLYANKYIDVIIFATYYRRNTEEDFKKAYEMWLTLTQTGNKVQFRKSRTFVAGLALNQNRPEIALKILEGETMYVAMRHIKLLAWAQTGQFEKVFSMLKATVRQHEQNQKIKQMTSNQVMTAIEKQVRLKGSQHDQDEFQSIKELITSENLFTDKTLDDILVTPFPVLPQANIYHKKA